MALPIIRSIVSTWARAAISGTTPPNAACSLTCDSTTLDRIRPRPSSKRSTNAAAVSSQVVSMPRTIICASCGLPLAGKCALQGALASRGDMVQSTAGLRIGTRGSPLALVQARTVRARLAGGLGVGGETVELVIIRTSGDTLQEGPLAEFGGKGLFTKEIEEALLDGRIDLAVPSSKDMASFGRRGLTPAGVP